MYLMKFCLPGQDIESLKGSFKALTDNENGSTISCSGTKPASESGLAGQTVANSTVTQILEEHLAPGPPSYSPTQVSTQ